MRFESISFVKRPYERLVCIGMAPGPRIPGAEKNSKLLCGDKYALVVEKLMGIKLLPV